MTMLTRCDSPGSRWTFLKPTRRFGGWPSTGTAQVDLPDLGAGDRPGVGHREGHRDRCGAVGGSAGLTTRSEISNVVYDSPKPNGNSGWMPWDWNQR